MANRIGENDPTLLALLGVSQLDAQSAASGAGTVTSVNISSPNSTITVGGGPITTSGTLTADLPTSGVTAGAYTAADITVDKYGRVTKAANGSGGSGTVTSVSLSAPLGGGTVTTSGTLGTSTFTNHGVLLGQSTSAITATAAGGANTFLAGVAGADPTFRAVDLSTADVTGNLGVSHLNSGTSASSSTFWRGDGAWAAATATGSLIGRRVFTATGSGTYTPTAGTASVIIELQAGGGGSGGVATAGASKVSLSGAGGGGEWVQVRLTSNFSGASYSVGVGGAAGSSGNNAGGNGGNTTFTNTAGSPTTYTANGGSGGAGGGGQTAPNFAISGAAGSGGNGDVVQSGQPGFPGSALFSTGGYAGAGGASHYSGGGAGSFVASANSSQSGAAPNGYGGGGGGCSNTGTAGNLAGIAGSQGVIIIWEYS